MSSTRDAYVISDLHLGAGKEDLLDDFSADDEVAFVRWVGQMAAGTTTLFINGDFLDFAQIEPEIEPGVPRHLLWDEDASRRKLAITMDGHASCFDALRRFIAIGGTLHILTGNHDFDLDWPGVRADLREHLGGTEENVAFTTGAHVHDGVHIEHGYQFTPENCPADPVAFRHRWGDRELLERVWGTDFVLSCLNPMKASAPFVDKVKPTLRLAYHGIAKRWIPRRQLLSIIILLRRRGIPWDAVSSVMDAEHEATLADVYGAFAEVDAQVLVRALLEEDADDLAAEIHALGPDEQWLVVQPGAVDESLGLEPLPSDATWIAETTDGRQRMGLFRPGRETRAARDRLARNGVTHVVFGHTHRIVDGAEDGRHFNPGTWNAHMRLDDPEVVKAIEERGGITLEMLSDSRFFRADRRAVHIRSTRGGSVTVQLIAVP